jgi:hypothetical protein
MSPVFCMEEWTSRGASGPEHMRNSCRRSKHGTTRGTNRMRERYWPLIAPRARRVGVSQRGAARLRAAWTSRAGSVRVKPQRFPRTKTSGRSVGKAEGRMSTRIVKTQRAQIHRCSGPVASETRRQSGVWFNAHNPWEQGAGTMGGGLHASSR